MGLFTITVQAHERALEHRDGRLVRVLQPGRYRRQRRATHQVLDVRERLTPVAPQEVPTADGVSVKVSAAVRWSIADVQAYVRVVDPAAVVYLAVQLGLREQLARTELTALVRQGRTEVDDALTEAAQHAAVEVGIDVLSVVVKDVVLPAELRSAFTELVTARQRGQAQLESARAETATLRSLANAARLLDDHPALAQLRLVQSAPPGTTVVLQVAAPGPASPAPTTAAVAED